jgi:hypothetical protein
MASPSCPKSPRLSSTLLSDVCAKLKERNIPFVVCSGYSKLEGACASGELVHKPATPQMLVITLQGVLANHRDNIQ